MIKVKMIYKPGLIIFFLFIFRPNTTTDNRDISRANLGVANLGR